MKLLRALVAIAVLALPPQAHAAYSALPTINVPAVCDGYILYAGLHTTNGSTTITPDATSGTPDLVFKAADVGKTYSITNPATVNSASTSAPTANTGTITAQAGTSATVSNAPGFTSASYAWASFRMYKTDNRVAIQAALDQAKALGGANLVFPPGVCATSGPLTFYSNTRLTGAGQAATTLMLANGSNSDMFKSAGFDSLRGTDSTAGVGNVQFENLQLDGNRGANTATNKGAANGTGSGIRIYGSQWNTLNLQINYFAGDGAYSEWSSNPGNPLNANYNAGPAGMEALMRGITMAYNGGWGWVYAGPHDSKGEHLYFVSNGLGGLLNIGNGSPLVLSAVHGYASPSGTFDFDIRLPYFTAYDMYAESGCRLTEFQYYIVNSICAGSNGLTLGLAGGDPVYHLHMANNRIDTLINVTGSGFRDTWAGGEISAFSGATYSPDSSVGVLGQDDRANNRKDCNYTGSSYVGCWYVDNASVGHFALNGDFMTFDYAHNISFKGPVQFKSYTVSTLPTGVTGAVAYVTDASACTRLSSVSGGGSTFCPVIYNGAAWVGQ